MQYFSVLSDVTVITSEGKKESLSLLMNDSGCMYSNNVGFQSMRICAYVKDLLITQRHLNCSNSFNVGKSWASKIGVGCLANSRMPSRPKSGGKCNFQLH